MPQVVVPPLERHLQRGHDGSQVESQDQLQDARDALQRDCWDVFHRATPVLLPGLLIPFEMLAPPAGPFHLKQAECGVA